MSFSDTISAGYTFKGPSFVLGGAMLDGASQEGLLVRVPLKTLNRHGLIAGATGTGKTKTLQGFAEQLSWQGVPVLLMDIKGDLSGLAQPSEGHPKIDERHAKIGVDHNPTAFPIELLSISDESGVRLRATVSEFGPVLFSKILGLNEVQSGIVSLLFKVADDRELPLLDLKDFKALLRYSTEEGKDEIQAEYGSISPASTGAILRRIIEIEQQGGDKFFGELSFQVSDLVRTNQDDKGIISILRLTDVQDRPKLFSTFMLCLLAEIYNTLPEQGDADKPRLVLFIDEAHLIFEEASKALLDQIEAIVRLIRSKGVGVFFVTQSPADIPDDVLGQLGLKIQHALRAFTAKDRKKIKQAAENYPLTEYYDTAELLTSMGIGEAAVTVLNEKGIPTPLVHTLLCAPQSRMGILSKREISAVVKQSELAAYYNEDVDRESAYEILNAKLKAAEAATEEPIELPEPRRRSSGKAEKSLLEEVMGSTMARQIGRTVAREVTRGLLGVLGIKSTRRRRRRR
ncbi:MAG: helicase HerA-like domain-containing protein [Bacteroidota bacterium]